ncbi:MAG: prolyl oligopeptidase family serine peptidase [Verrucomicrobiae bacterium]|nr:prolyl oligopeptidase family serine peptidase [Verrucomicrobiae bacterium]MCB1092226.1 prolyl oligopeptidase family serine peptidase [Verrucomicrobiae bacterium]
MKTNPVSLFSMVAGVILLSLITGSEANARTWTATDGRTLEAEFVSATADGVTVKLANGTTRTLPLAVLSAGDKEWLASQATASAKPVALTGPFAELVTGDWALSELEGLPYAFFGPKELESGRKYPLLLALHGKSDNNENGKQVGGWMKTFTKPEELQTRACFVVAPLCYQPYGATGGGWSDKPGDQAIALVKAAMKALPIDESRVYVIGYSMGGFGTCHLMAQEPKLFTAGVPVAGYGSSGDAGELKRKPIWLFHAADDTVVSVDGARQFADAMGRSKTFQYTEYPDGGHGIIGRVFDDPKVHEWLFQQKEE